MSAWLVAAAMGAACLGWGAMALAVLRTGPGPAWCGRLAWSFGLGMGILGWLIFWAALAGWTTKAALALPVAAGLPGLWLLRPPSATPPRQPFTPWTWALLALGAAVMAGDLMEGLAPPSDADSLAYHFAIPRQILSEGRLVFVPRAADGAIPLLLQMTYLAALGLGGETAMTLWCCLSGWAAAFITYAVGRGLMPRDWALAAALAMMTLPATLYGAGSGQVETRMAVFCTLAIVAAVASRRAGTDGLGLAAVAGLAAGFAMASKYPGLLVAFLCGAAVLLAPGGLRRATAFSAACLAVGAQWYGWNWANTGDPVFPMLFGTLPYHPGTPWTAGQDIAFRIWGSRIEAPLPRDPWLVLTYPFMVTFFPSEALDGGRTGLGVLPVLLLPLAVLGGWRARRSEAARSWLAMAAIVLGFYLLWHGFGASQRVRHYLPFMPLVLVGLTAAARATPFARQTAAGLGLGLLMQSGAQALFVAQFATHLASGEDRTAFIERTVPLSFAVTWANRTLKPGEKLVMAERQWIYLLDVPSLFVTPNQQAVIEIRDDNTDARRFLAQVRAVGGTHVMLPHAVAADIGVKHVGNPFFDLTGDAVAAGCGKVVADLEGPMPTLSRSLAFMGSPDRIVRIPVVAFSPPPCPLD